MFSDNDMSHLAELTLFYIFGAINILAPRGAKDITYVS